MKIKSFLTLAWETLFIQHYTYRLIDHITDNDYDGENEDDDEEKAKEEMKEVKQLEMLVQDGDVALSAKFNFYIF